MCKSGCLAHTGSLVLALSLSQLAEVTHFWHVDFLKPSFFRIGHPGLNTPLLGCLFCFSALQTGSSVQQQTGGRRKRRRRRAHAIFHINLTPLAGIRNSLDFQRFHHPFLMQMHQKTGRWKSSRWHLPTGFSSARCDSVTFDEGASAQKPAVLMRRLNSARIFTPSCDLLLQILSFLMEWVQRFRDLEAKTLNLDLSWLTCLHIFPPFDS